MGKRERDAGDAELAARANTDIYKRTSIDSWQNGRKKREHERETQ